ncbi:hypothetical protein NIES2098_02990 [Calothrix sp. NIES-2098]|nr:hypothetical protein NIES2098_02990 [Calothrix sp. NIES-2098]
MLCPCCKIKYKNYLKTAFDNAKATFFVPKFYVIGKKVGIDSFSRVLRDRIS